MGRQRSPNRDSALKVFLDHDGKITSKEIAEMLQEKLTNINTWRTTDKWEDKLHGKVGAPYGNKNAVGNNGGAPLKNTNNYIHGFYSKYLPKKTFDIMKAIETLDPIDMLWQNICIKYAAIINSQKIMFVRNSRDVTKVVKKSKGIPVIENGKEVIKNTEEEFVLMLAEEKQANFLKAQSTAMSTLAKMIKQYDEMIHANWDTVTEEQKLRVKKLKQEMQINSEKLTMAKARLGLNEKGNRKLEDLI